jgi:hypothetical protein
MESPCGKGVRESADGVVEKHPDMGHAEVQPFRDLLVAEVLLKAQTDDRALLGMELLDKEPGQARQFETFDDLAGEGFDGGIGRRGLGGIVFACGGFAGLTATVIHREVVDRAVEPGAGESDGIPLAREAKEGLLHQILGGLPIASELTGVEEERAFQTVEKLPQGTFGGSRGGSGGLESEHPEGGFSVKPVGSSLLMTPQPPIY